MRNIFVTLFCFCFFSVSSNTLPYVMKVENLQNFVSTGNEFSFQVEVLDYYDLNPIEDEIIVDAAIIDSNAKILVEGVARLDKNNNEVTLDMPEDLPSGGYLLAVFPAIDRTRYLSYSVSPINVINIKEFDKDNLANLNTFSPYLRSILDDSIKGVNITENNNFLAFSFKEPNGQKLTIKFGDQVITEQNVYAKEIVLNKENWPQRILFLTISEGTSVISGYYDNSDRKDFSAFSLSYKEGEFKTLYRQPETTTTAGKDLYINGTVSDETEYKLVTLCVRGDTSLFKYAYTNPNGEFLFSPLNNLKGINQVQIKEIGSQGKIDNLETNLIITNNDNFNSPIPFRLHQSTSSETFKEIIVKKFHESSIRKHDMKYYTPLSYEKDINLASYETLESTTEMIEELMPLKRFKIKKGKPQLRLLNNLNNSFYDHPPQIMIDGYLVDGVEELIDLPINEIKSFRVSYAGYKLQDLGPLGRFGLVSVFTHSGNYQPSNSTIVNIKGPLE